eukprot:1075935-Amphidinium_carterae.1
MIVYSLESKKAAWGRAESSDSSSHQQGRQISSHCEWSSGLVGGRESGGGTQLVTANPTMQDDADLPGVSLEESNAAINKPAQANEKAKEPKAEP